MASTTRIDTEATGSGLSSAGQTRLAAIGAGIPTAPMCSHVAGTPAALSGLLAARLAVLGEKVGTGIATASASVATYTATEETNRASLTT